MELFVHGSTGVRELSFDSLQIINSISLPVNSYGAVDLPGDCVDDLAVCIPSGQSLINLPKQDWITPLRLKDSGGNFVPYSDLTTATSATNNFFGFPFTGWSFFWNVNDFVEPTGRFFGAKGGTKSGYQIFKERRQIQMSEDFINSHIVLLYISDGQSIDAASQIDVQAIQCIRAFQNWKMSPNRDNENSPEGRHWHNQRRLLRARLNPLTKVDILNIIRNSYTATIKS